MRDHAIGGDVGPDGRAGHVRSSDRRTRVAVLAGGRSSEHEISLASARSVLGALDPARYEVSQSRSAGTGAGSSARARALAGRAAETLPIPTAETPAPLGPIDVVLPILHGPFGEDGTVQGLLELAGVPYVGPGVLASALCMDKDVFKRVMRDQRHAGCGACRAADGDSVRNPFGYPVFVKPARLGSSVGISKVREESELEPAVELARRHDEKVLVEEFVPGIEVEVGLLGNRRRRSRRSRARSSPHCATGTTSSSKYDEGGMDLIVPPRIPTSRWTRVQALAVTAFVATECEGMARVDCFVRDDGEVLVNELNTIPGFTATSVYAKLFEASGVPYPRAARPADRARARAPRAPREPQVLARPRWTVRDHFDG